MAATSSSPHRSPTTASPRRLIASGNVADRRPRGHERLFRRDRHHRRFRRWLRQRAARRDRRQDLFRGRKRRAAKAASSPPSTMASTRPASPARSSRTRRRSGASRRSKIIWNGKAKTVRFENSPLRVLRPPARQLAGLRDRRPDGEAQDRGFLFPGISSKSELGFGLAVPYYFALSPTYDLTVDRHRLHQAGLPRRGRMAPALQQWRIQPKHRRHLPGRSRASSTSTQSIPDRRAIRTSCAAWWARRAASRSIHAGTSAGTSSSSPTRTSPTPMTFDGYNDYVHQSEVYLTGLGRPQLFRPERHAFRGPGRRSSTRTRLRRNDEQPWVLPSFDYSYTPDEPVFGGELNFDLNARVINRSELDDSPATIPRSMRTSSAASRALDSRLTAEAEWKRSFITDGGLVMTPLLGIPGRHDACQPVADSVAAINSMASDTACHTRQIGVLADIRSAYYRFMATAGLELRFPCCSPSTSASHVLEPMAQLFARAGRALMRTTRHPQRGRTEFRVRRNLAVRARQVLRLRPHRRRHARQYRAALLGQLRQWLDRQRLFGQSYHLAGENSFAAPDLVNAGAFSGLETDTSDLSAWSASPRRSAFRLRPAPARRADA